MFERLKKYDKKAIGQFIRFGIVGIINTLITLIVIYFLQEILHVKYTISNFIGYIAGVVNSFFWNKLWVFKKLIVTLSAKPSYSSSVSGYAMAYNLYRYSFW